MALTAEFTPLELGSLRDYAHRMKDDGWRFVQTHAVNCGDTVDLYYSFMKDGHVRNYRIEGVTAEMPVPSITDIFLAAFVFENEARELFGVDMRDIALDFHGGLYAPAENEPMRFISPEQKAAIDKARKAAALKLEKAAHAAKPAENAEDKAKSFELSDEKRAKLEEKLASMPPEKAAKVRAALAAKEAKAATETAKGEKTGETAAPGAPQKESGKKSSAEGGVSGVTQANRDVELEAKLEMMDEGKADVVRRALARRASEKGGE